MKASRVVFPVVIFAISIGVYTYLNTQNEHDQAEAPKTAGHVDVNEKKKNFFDKMRPGFEKENQRVAAERELLLEIKNDLDDLSGSQLSDLKKLGAAYQMDELEGDKVDPAWFETLLTRVNVLPESLVLSQAAEESAWGTSRFAHEANNYFGQWCFTEGCGIVPTNRNQGATHEVASFDSPQESIQAYFSNVNSHNAYDSLRMTREKLADSGEDLYSMAAAKELSNGLLKYSERGQAYVDDLQAIILVNQDYWKSGSE